MTFDKVFLQSQNPDCLAQVLSFLNCNDLTSVSRTCKTMQHTIFETDSKEGNVNLIWQGAEEELTTPWGRQKDFLTEEVRRVGENAREHCHLFALASKAAKTCELKDEIEENRMKVDGVLANLMNIRGYDAENIAKKKALAANETQTMEEASQNIKYVPLSDADDEEEMEKRASEQSLRLREKWERLQQLDEPEKTIHHDIFVRITQIATGELISEGFCDSVQTVRWFCGLEWSSECCPFPDLNPTALHAILDFESLEGIKPENVREDFPKLNLTAVVIDRRNHDIQCLFQQDQTIETSLEMQGPGNGMFHYFTKYSFGPQAKWGSDSIQLGPYIAHDSYYLGFSLCLFVSPERKDGAERLVVPVLEVAVRKDRSAFRMASLKNLQAQYGITFG